MLKRYFIVFVCLLFLSLSFVHAELTAQEKDKINSDYQSLPDGKNYNFFYRYYLMYNQSDVHFGDLLSSGKTWQSLFSTTGVVTKDFLGFGGYETFRGSEYGFILGFFAALFMWIFCKLRQGYRWLVVFSGGTVKKGYDPEKDLRERSLSEWVVFVAGSFWKVLVFTVMFGVFMYVPFINRIVQIITLQMFDMGVLAHALLLAVEIGILPQVIEDYSQSKLEIGALKKRIEMEKGMKRNQIDGQIKN